MSRNFVDLAVIENTYTDKIWIKNLDCRNYTCSFDNLVESFKTNRLQSKKLMEDANNQQFKGFEFHHILMYENDVKSIIEGFRFLRSYYFSKKIYGSGTKNFLKYENLEKIFFKLVTDENIFEKMSSEIRMIKNNDELFIKDPIIKDDLQNKFIIVIYKNKVNSKIYPTVILGKNISKFKQGTIENSVKIYLEHKNFDAWRNTNHIFSKEFSKYGEENFEIKIVIKNSLVEAQQEYENIIKNNYFKLYRNRINSAGCLGNAVTKKLKEKLKWSNCDVEDCGTVFFIRDKKSGKGYLFATLTYNNCSSTYDLMYSLIGVKTDNVNGYYDEFCMYQGDIHDFISFYRDDRDVECIIYNYNSTNWREELKDWFNLYENVILNKEWLRKNFSFLFLDVQNKRIKEQQTELVKTEIESENGFAKAQRMLEEHIENEVYDRINEITTIDLRGNKDYLIKMSEFYGKNGITDYINYLIEKDKNEKAKNGMTNLEVCQALNEIEKKYKAEMLEKGLINN